MTAADDESPRGTGSSPIPFAERLAQSGLFQELFDEGMNLVEETAAYLDGPGRLDARNLNRSASLAYASESMRLTTRLMQMASWLLLQRAVREGELTREEAAEERRRIRLEETRRDAVAHRGDQPEALLLLIERAFRLHERIRHLDDAMKGVDLAPRRENAVARDLDRLAAAFSASRA